jgi:two-component system, OmpR family, sensor kinase
VSKSLYWRIAVGFVACLATLLIVQAVLFVWVVARSGRVIPNQPPDRLAQTIAVDIAQTLEQSPDADLDAYVRREYGDAQPFFVLLTGGRTIQINGDFDAEAMRDARQRLQVIALRGPGFGRGGAGFPPREGGGFGRGAAAPPDGIDPNRGSPAPPDRGEADRRDFPGRRGGPRGGPPGFRGPRPALIVVGTEVKGLVVVPPGVSFPFLLRRYAPTLAIAALITLVVGTALSAFAIVGPVRRRLRDVETTARQLGGGDWSARAPVSGRDEIAAVATAFNAMAEELAARAQALAESDRARRQLLADVSHELTTPVTAIRGYLETLRMPDFDLDEATRGRYLAIIGDESARLERIIGDLLDLARLEGGGSALVDDDVAVADLFARVQARHERALAEAGVSLETGIAPGAGRLHGDRDRLEQALQNLVSNALRYAPSGSAIELAASPAPGSSLAITVTDHGAGIAGEHLPRIFDRFYKAETSRAVRTGTGGSGLGLSIVKAIAEQHGGSVSVSSAPGNTVFKLVLPA